MRSACQDCCHGLVVTYDWFNHGPTGCISIARGKLGPTLVLASHKLSTHPVRQARLVIKSLAAEKLVTASGVILASLHRVVVTL